MKPGTRTRAFRGRAAWVFCSTGIVAGLLFGACGGSSDSKGDADKGGDDGEAGFGPAGASGTSGSSGTSGASGASTIGGTTGNGGTGMGGSTSGTTGMGGEGADGPGPGECVPSGLPCASGPDCCTFSCVDGVCSDDQCTADNEACAANEECCGGVCTNEICVPLGDGCRTSGNSCDTGADCCSRYCLDGLCSTPSYCRQLGDTCTNAFDCCGGLCVIANGATLGTCALAPASGGGGCLSAGEVCSGGAVYDPENPPETCGGECCSRSCRPYAPTGVLICQPPSGCHPTGELCTEDLDCCGAEGRPDGDRVGTSCSKEDGNAIGRCNQGNACSPAGGICRLDEVSCNATANCCAGNVNQVMVCKQDNLGIPRCLVGEIDCTDPSQFAGQACASSADCCNLPCVANPDGDDPPFVCGADRCVPSGGSCTTTADCCRGLPCNVPPGSLRGTCGDTGTGGTGSGGTAGMGGTNTGGMGGTSTGGSNTGGSAGACSAYGQACEMTADCCNGVPCTNGFCVDDVR